MSHKTDQSFHRFLILWCGELLSSIGSGLTSFGLGVYVFGLTGKASATALVTLCAFLPGLLLGVPSGVLADRYDRRLLMILGDGLSALGILFILVCVLRGEAQVWQICAGAAISSVFSSLLEPAYKATVTDLLTPEQYTKASGLVGVAGSSKYLISPVLAGFLLLISDIRLLLIVDICTFFVTAAATLAVKRGIATAKPQEARPFVRELMDGWRALSADRGVLYLVALSAAITFFMGFLQTLITPMMLSFTDSAVLGMAETICSTGMLVSSLFLGMAALKKSHVKILTLSLSAAGICMACFGLGQNIVPICVFGFLFFATLPFANSSLDYLIRTHIDNSCQGRVWGLIGILSQFGYVAAYALSGTLADHAGQLLGVSVGRSSGFLISGSGALLSVTALALYHVQSIRQLEE